MQPEAPQAPKHTSSRPIALTIAGSDSSGGAGIQADLKTFSALGVYGSTVITALTAQNTLGVQDVLAIGPNFVKAQISSVISDLNVRAVKTGMLANTAIIETVVERLETAPLVPLITDPVMVATSGDRLLDKAAVAALKTALIPRCDLITPNISEAALLLGTAPASTWVEMESQAKALLQLGCKAVLLKGGHFNAKAPEAGLARDVLATNDQLQWFEAQWINTRNSHGTGCTLSAAITAYMASGQSMSSAIQNAKTYLTAALAAGQSIDIGHGQGPVDHLHSIPQPD